jgi:acyl-CoA thioester hydrolase
MPDNNTAAAEFDPRDRAQYADWAAASIRYADLDPNGHVNNGAINEYFEDGRVRFRTARMAKFGDNILTGFAIARFAVDYHAPLSYPGGVEIGTVVKRIGRTSYVLGQGVFSGEGCIASAEVVTVYFNSDTGASQPLTGELRSVLEAAMIASARP